ncbi:alpha/beta fold hydrolase [Salinicola aestuarinus]|uniref:alpha/beta fold hydrolase n=1 Tax=Salinicola aestuarinus TaxID=1949082 RepID=UPI001FD97D17|nr:alpha/beta fold hydrolase [Salinicola aestuarinus]
MRLHATDTADSTEMPSGTTPLVILHGLMGSADNWRSHIKQWQARQRVVAVDLRNHGRSPHGRGMSYEAMANDVLELLASLGLERVNLLGHSMGGKVAMTLARLQPGRVAHLVVADIAPVAYEHGHDEVFEAMRRVEAGSPTSRSEANTLMSEVIESTPTRQFLATNLIKGDDGIMTWRVGLDEIEAGYADIIAPPGGNETFDGPSLVIRGGASSYVQDAHREAIEAVLTDVTLETLEGAGHWLHAEQPEAFRERIDHFLQSSA